MQLDKNQIRKILPHRYPFLLIDEVIELELGRRVVAIKNVKTNDWFFRGHFPGRPIMPGVLIIETMAQASIILYYITYKDNVAKKLDYYLGSVNKATFKHPVVPGDQLKIDAQTVRLSLIGGIASVKVFVKDRQIAEAELILGVKQ